MNKIDKLRQDIEERLSNKRGAGAIRASEINVKIGSKMVSFYDPFSSHREYEQEVVVDLQSLIEKILEHCNLSANIAPPVPEKLVVKKKDASAK